MKRDLASMFSGAVMPGDEASTFVRRQLTTGEPQLPQYDPHGGWDTFKNAGYMGASMAPGGGIADAAGQLGGPSLAQNLRDKNYGSAAMQGLGAAADFAGPAGAVGKGLAGLMAGAVKAAAGSKAVPAMIIGGRALERAFPGQEARAIAMERAGKTPEEIAQETKLWRGPDVSLTDVRNPNAPGPWRGELDDSGIKINFNPQSRALRKGVPITDVITHNALFDAVPEAANYKVIYHPTSAKEAYFVPPGQNSKAMEGALVLGPSAATDLKKNPEELINSIVHETNHGTDFALGLPAGGSASYIGHPQVQAEIARTAQSLDPNSPIGRLYQGMIATEKNNPMRIYRRLAGEEQAFAAGGRWWMPPEMREQKRVFNNPGFGYMFPVSEQLAAPQGLWERIYENATGRERPIDHSLP